MLHPKLFRSFFVALAFFWVVPLLTLGVEVREGWAQESRSEERQPEAIEELTVEGRLDEQSEKLEDGSYFKAYPFQGAAGQTVTIEMVSRDFNTYLILVDENGNEIAENDDGNNGTNAKITATLPTAGTYIILANTRNAGEIGSYRLNVQITAARSADRQVTQGTDSAKKQEADWFFEQGFQQFQANQFQDALQSWQKALELYRAIQNREGVAGTLLGLGRISHDLSQYPQALSFYQQALTAYRDLGKQYEEGITLNNIGSIYDLLSQYPQALEYYQQALSIIREIKDRHQEGAILGNIGLVYSSLGQYPQALEHYQQALSIAREVKDLDGEGTILNNIGLVSHYLGQYPEALEYYQQALLIRRSINDYNGQGNTLNNIGGVYDLLSQYPQALEYYQQALVVFREVENRRGEGSTLNNIGLTYSSINQYSQALEHYKQALTILREIRNRSGEGLTLNNIGQAYDSLKQYSQALEYYQQALIIAREILDRRAQSAILSNVGTSFLETQQYVAAEETLFQAITQLELLRASELNDAAKIAIFETQVDNYEALQQVLIAQNNPEKTLKALEVSERGRTRAFVELFAVRQVNLTIATSPPNIAEIKRIAQQQNATLVQYSVIENGVGDPMLYIWVIQPTGDIQFRSADLSTVNLSELVSSARRSIGISDNVRGDIEPILTPEGEARQKQWLRQLHQVLIEPIQDLLPTQTEAPIVFIPHNELFSVPFAALVNAEGDYLIQNHTLLTAPSIQVLGLTQTLSRHQGPINSSNALVVGNPTMPKYWNPNTDQEQQLDPLPSSAVEATVIAADFNTQPLLQDRATETTVVQQMQTAQIIHLTTHGLLNYGNPQDSGVRDFPGAIALAPSATDDGLLTASEILNLKLTADLVVLSACDSGSGRITGDGVVGLSRALVTAGVPSILVSLWAVDDDATADLMQEFYRRWRNPNQPQSKAQALRQAMLTTMQTNPNPKFWAAFTLIGQGG